MFYTQRPFMSAWVSNRYECGQLVLLKERSTTKKRAYNNWLKLLHLVWHFVHGVVQTSTHYLREDECARWRQEGESSRLPANNSFKQMYANFHKAFVHIFLSVLGCLIPWQHVKCLNNHLHTKTQRERDHERQRQTQKERKTVMRFLLTFP